MRRQLYVRRIKSSVWHFCESCSNYPKKKTPVVQYVGGTPEKGSLCDQCQAKEKRGTCT